jgi:hypothetical protein
MLITYILFLTKLQKGKPGEMDLPLLKKRYHTNFYRHDIYIFIAVSASIALRTGIDDISGFGDP